MIPVVVVQIKKFKNKVHSFSNFASWRTHPTQSTGPKPIQLVPRHLFFFTDISDIGRSNPKNQKKRFNWFFEFYFWEDPPHPVNWSLTHSTGPQTPFLKISWYRSLKSQKFWKQVASYFEFFLFERPLLRYQLKTVFGDQLNGLGTSWLGGGGGHPKPKFEKKCTLFFEIFWFERPLPKYLLKTVFTL